jgi:hypothetical protein
MKRDEHKTRMIFKKFPEGDVVALMIDDIQQDGRGQTWVTSYQRIGQHSGASPELLQELPDATPEERKALVSELNNLIGYQVEDVTGK